MMKTFYMVVVGVALPLALASCPENYVGFRQSCYKVINKGPTNWKDARIDCQSEGADLAVLDSPEKITQMSQYIDKSLPVDSGRDSVYWVGGYIADDLWVWVNGNRMNLKSNVWIPDTPDKITGESYACLGGPRTHRRRYLFNENSHLPGFICEV